jgi:chemotaxis protein CheY-P-specific phosphatase CheC
MIRKNIKLMKSSVNIELINNIPKLMNPEEISTTLVYTRAYDHLSYVVITSSSLKHFLRLIDILLNKKIDYYEALSEENKSSVFELGNIINGYFISSLNNLFDTKFDYKESELSVNPYRAIEDFKFGDIYREKINALTFISNFKVEWNEVEDIEGKIILLTEEDKVDTILEAISKKIKMT